MVYGDRLMRILAEEALCRLPHVREGRVETPCGVADGPVETERRRLCLVSVVRSGDILQEAVRQLEPGTAVGKILIQGRRKNFRRKNARRARYNYEPKCEIFSKKKWET